MKTHTLVKDSNRVPAMTIRVESGMILSTTIFKFLRTSRDVVRIYMQVIKFDAVWYSKVLMLE